MVVRVRRDLRTLLHLTRGRIIRAERGRSGSGRNRHGRDGHDAVVEVPPGTAIFDATTGDIIQDLTVDGERHVLLTGGRGGKGNAHFATSRNQTPRFAQDGEPGEERDLRIELRLIADIGFVGSPNAGKSTLLGRLTAATPKIGAYPFTTKTPNLGVMQLDTRQLVLADIPGLIEGASEGAGMGVRFLKHVARTRTLAYIVDLQEEHPGRTLSMLEHELAAYDVRLTERPRVVVGNKLDLEGSAQRLEDLARALPDDRVIGVSALTGEGMRELAGMFLAVGDGA